MPSPGWIRTTWLRSNEDDTNRYSDVARGVPEAVSFVAAATEVRVPVIVLGELRAGFRRGTRATENESALKAFLAKPGVSPVGLDEMTSFHYAEIELELRKKGMPIPTNDV